MNACHLRVKRASTPERRGEGDADEEIAVGRVGIARQCIGLRYQLVAVERTVRQVRASNGYSTFATGHGSLIAKYRTVQRHKSI